jgi:predicted nucleic acid-binding protein
MPRTKTLVVNTGPIIALVAALGDLRVLQVYQRVRVPVEVCQEISAGGPAQFAVAEFEAAHWLEKREQPLSIAPVLLNTLDQGEAAVIQLALDENVKTVCIDEAAGRRMARLYDLSVTGSIGVLLRAKSEGYEFSMREAIDRMQAQGVWLSDRVIAFALAQAGEA